LVHLVVADVAIPFSYIRVAPTGLQNLLLQHPKVADAAVLGLYSKEEETEAPRAYVVPREGLLDPKDTNARKSLEKEVENWADGKVADHEKIRAGVKVTEQISKR